MSSRSLLVATILLSLASLGILSSASLVRTLANSCYTANPNGFVLSQMNRAMTTPFHAPSLLRTPNAVTLPEYDEQLGLTLTQDLSSISYNVTAVQQDYEHSFGAANKTGPAYLLNGLSDQGYWYQVGLSWDWCGPDPCFVTVSGTVVQYAPGFNAIYAVFASNRTEVYPAGGGAVLVSLSVNQGDSVLLSLNFSCGNVVMYVHDWNTSATSWETYSSQGATYFVGLRNSERNSQGFFTGLMTEQYHDKPYYGNMQEVVYSDMTDAKASAWMWIDEFNSVNSTEVLFFDSRLVSFTDPTQFQSFFSHGETEYSNAYQFITGARAISFSPSIPWVNERVLFNASTSYYENGLMTSYSWDFGDGNVTAVTSQTTTHFYAKEGKYTVTANVTDSVGSWGVMSSYIAVTFRTDLNKDFQVNILDIGSVAIAYGSRHGDTNWNPNADLNKDGLINILDLSMLAIDYGKHLPR